MTDSKQDANGKKNCIEDGALYLKLNKPIIKKKKIDTFSLLSKFLFFSPAFSGVLYKAARHRQERFQGEEKRISLKDLKALRRYHEVCPSVYADAGCCRLRVERLFSSIFL